MGRHDKPENQQQEHLEYLALCSEYRAMVANGLGWRARRLGRRIVRMERELGLK
jgi:hypothetical protein